MSYRVPECDIAEYYRSGYIVFRQVLPTSLVRDLRRECDKGAAVVRSQKDAQAQRFQPVSRYADHLSLKPFEDYVQLPALREAMDQTLSPRHYWGKAEVMGVLINPVDEAWCTHWHRDMTLESSRLPVDEFHDIMLDWNSANQVNCALYDDDCTWFVPGSHLRARDLPGETAAQHAGGDGVGWGKKAGEVDPVERERACLNYTKGMPGAVQLRLNAGDFAMYRPIGWHIGNYTPSKKRATLHDAVFTPEYEVWWKQWIAGGSPRWKRVAELKQIASAK